MHTTDSSLRTRISLSMNRPPLRRRLVTLVSLGIALALITPAVTSADQRGEEIAR